MKKLYRMLADNEQEWIGCATSPENAEEKCFYDEEPRSLVRYTLQVLKDVRITKSIKQKGWIDIYKNESISLFG